MVLALEDSPVVTGFDFILGFPKPPPTVVGLAGFGDGGAGGAAACSQVFLFSLSEL